MNIKLFMRQYGILVRMALITFVSLLGLLFGVLPFTQKTVALWQETAALKTQISSMNAKLAMLTLLDENALRADALTLSSTVPPDKSFPTVMTTVDTVAGQTGVSLVDLTLSKAGSLATASAEKLSVDERKIGASILPVSVRVTGTYDALQTFLSTIGSVRRLFHIQSVSVNFSENNTVSAQVVLATYYAPYPATISRATDAIADISPEERTTIAQLAAFPLASQPPQATESAAQTIGKTDIFSY